MISNPGISEDRLEQGDVLLNGEILTKGTFEASIVSDIVEDKFGISDQSIAINGILKTKYYIKELNQIESIRYFIDEVFVTKESYSSEDDTVIYEFKAMFFKPKFQDTDYERIPRE